MKYWWTEYCTGQPSREGDSWCQKWLDWIEQIGWIETKVVQMIDQTFLLLLLEIKASQEKMDANIFEMKAS
jgi:hypothetical protein